MPIDYEIQNIEGDSSIEVSTQNSSDELLETSSKAKRKIYYQGRIQDFYNRVSN